MTTTQESIVKTAREVYIESYPMCCLANTKQKQSFLSLTYLKKVKVKKEKLSATMEMLMPMYEMRLNAKECCFWGERRQKNLNIFFFSFYYSRVQCKRYW